MTQTAALITRQAHDPIAWLAQPIEWLGLASGIITAGQFVEHVNAVAQQLPASVERQYAINLCANRYVFMVVFCAVIVRGQTNLLPPNKNSATQTRLQERYQGSFTVHDGQIELAGGASVDITDFNFNGKSGFLVPQIDLKHIAAICFTSGSTGNAKAITKTWQIIIESTEINRCYMLPNQEQTFYHLATVPSQHMWGLETTVMMALRASVCVADAQPFYPAEIVAALKQLPTPSTLIATPLHLRAINASATDGAEVANTLVATAPLSKELAKSIEEKLNTQVREIYGCSEVGSMAVRNTAQSDQWQRFSGLHFDTDATGQTVVSTKHLSEDVTLDDQITLLDESHFILAGRNTDQINIAGKRGSLTEVNNVLMKFADLVDGTVIFPPQQRNVPRLVALVVLSSQASKVELREHFSKYLDAAFVPRPILVVDALPREENGKLIKSQILALYESLTSQNKQT